jgi:hypothetical protein
MSANRSATLSELLNIAAPFRRVNWSAGGAEQGPAVTTFTANGGRQFLVVEYVQRGEIVGFDVFVPVTDSNSVVETAAALTKYLENREGLAVEAILRPALDELETAHRHLSNLYACADDGDDPPARVDLDRGVEGLSALSRAMGRLKAAVGDE